jgi:5-methylcytosine-specific restriction endonuclease McrA
MAVRIRHCFYCGRALSRTKATKDHMMPRSKGGSNASRNIVDACKRCNCDKGCLTLDEFRIVMAFRQGVVKKPKEFEFPGETRRRLAEF